MTPIAADPALSNPALQYRTQAPLPVQTDVLLVGAGVMSATLGVLLRLLAPGLRITVVEALGEPSRESSDAWNNAGTGHAALCELNYTPEQPDGTIATARAVAINEQFQLSRQLWATLVERGLLPRPGEFIHAVPHMSFVHGADAVAFLRKRHGALAAHPLFAAMVFSEDPARLREWFPLMMEGRAAGEPVAATRCDDGTDLDFGALARMLFAALGDEASVHLHHRVADLTQTPGRTWRVTIAHPGGKSQLEARFVFLGAGGGALPLLQRAGIAEARGYGGFPVSGQWLRCINRSLIEQHRAKVYGKPAIGAPPMSVPHLDTRIIHGQRELLFGPFAGFSTRFLKAGSYADLPMSIGPGNLVPMLAAGAGNVGLTRYLIGQVLQKDADRLRALQDFVPTARLGDWRLEIAGQRVQIIKPHPTRRGVLEFGTEMIRSADSTLAALLGASPGASTAVAVMLDLIAKAPLPVLTPAQATPDALRTLVPSYGVSLAQDPALLSRLNARTTELLQLSGS